MSSNEGRPDRADDAHYSELLDQLCEQRLSESGRQTLLENLRSSASRRRSYIEYVSLHFWLRERYRRLQREDAEETDPAAPASLSTTPELRPGAGRRRTRLWFFAVAATLFVAAASTYLIFGGQRTTKSGPPGRIAAFLVNTEDCRWSGEQSPREVGAVVREGDRINLESGLAELQFDSGVRTVVRAPATLHIVSAQSCRLESGELVARMDGDAARFAVAAGDARIVDQGTEFGARLLDNRRVEIEVFEGEIAVHDASLPPQQDAPAYTLAAGQTAAGSVVRGQVASDRKTDMPLSRPFVRALSAAARPFDGRRQSLRAVDGFAVVRDGRSLSGVSTGAGWDGPWSDHAVEFVTTDVAVTAGEATNNGPGGAAVHRNLAHPLTASEAVYASARFRIDGSDPVCTAWVMLFQRSSAPGGGEAELMAFGICDGRFSARLASKTVDLALLPAAKWSGDFGDYKAGEEHFIVAKLEFDAMSDNERLSLWIDPLAAGDAEPEPDHAVRRDTGKTTADAAAVRFWEFDGETRGRIDDLRIGTTWAAVTQ